MGCWNATCMLTNLPIINGEEMYCIFLGMTVEYKTAYDRKAGRPFDIGNFDYSYCHPNEVFKPIGLFFTARYDDYGWFEEPCQNYKYNIEILKNHVVTILKSEHYKEDITKDTLNEDSIREIVRENRLMVSSGYQTYVVAPVFIKKHVLDHIFKNHNPKGYDDVYLIDKVQQGIDENIVDYKEFIEHGLGAVLHVNSDYRTRDFFILPRIRDIHETAIDNNDDAKLKAYNTGIIQHAQLLSFMNSGRMSYNIPSGAGSQNTDTSCQELLAKLTLEESERIKQYYDE